MVVILFSDTERDPVLQIHRPSRSYMSLSFRRLLRKKLAVTSLGIVILMYSAGLLAPLVTPYGYDDQDYSVANQGPSFAHPFGTDRLGRDMLTRIVYSLRKNVIITLT